MKYIFTYRLDSSITHEVDVSGRQAAWTALSELLKMPKSYLYPVYHLDKVDKERPGRKKASIDVEG